MLSSRIRALFIAPGALPMLTHAMSNTAAADSASMTMANRIVVARWSFMGTKMADR